MRLTKNWLITNANNTSYSRGRLAPVKKINGKEAETKAFAAELRKMYVRLPAFFYELKRGGS